MQQLARACGLPHQALAVDQLLRQPLAGEREPPKQRKPAFTVGHITGAHGCLEVSGQVVERQLAQVFQAVIALDALAQPRKPCRHPRLPRLDPVFARRHCGRGADQRQQHQRAAPRVMGRGGGGVYPLLAAGDKLLVLQRGQIAGQVAHAVHDAAAHVGANQRQRAIHVARFAQCDGFVQLFELLLGHIVDLHHQHGLRGVVGGGRFEGGHLSGDGREGLLIRLQVRSVACEQITPLPGFGVLERAAEPVELAHGRCRAVHGVHCLRAGLRGLVVDQRNHHGGQRRQHEPGHQRARDGKVVRGGLKA